MKRGGVRGLRRGGEVAREGGKEGEKEAVE
jgi:hypothetical protein